MASITIRQLDESIKQKLRLQAVKNGHSMEAEARTILNDLFAEKKPTATGLASQIWAITKAYTVDYKDVPLADRKAKPSHRGLDFSDEAFG